MRAVSAGDPFIADACYPEGGGAKQGSPPGQPATNSSRGPAAGASSGRRVGGTPLRACTGTASAKLPLCRAAGQRARHQKAAAGAIIATALAALAVALGVRRWGGSKKGAGHQSLRGKDRPEEVEAGQGDCLQQERDGVAPLLPSGVLHSRGAASRPAASSAAAADGTASWRLQSTSLRLRPEDFSIVVDGAGRPELLGSGASSKVQCWAPICCVCSLVLVTPSRPACVSAGVQGPVVWPLACCHQSGKPAGSVAGTAGWHSLVHSQRPAAGGAGSQTVA